MLQFWGLWVIRSLSAASVLVLQTPDSSSGSSCSSVCHSSTSQVSCSSVQCYPYHHHGTSFILASLFNTLHDLGGSTETLQVWSSQFLSSIYTIVLELHPVILLHDVNMHQKHTEVCFQDEQSKPWMTTMPQRCLSTIHLCLDFS